MYSQQARTLALLGFATAGLLSAQSISSGAITGTITDPSGAAVPGATITVQNPVSHYKNEAKSDDTGTYKLNNVPFNRYHVTVAAKGLQAADHDASVRSTVPVTLDFKLQLATENTVVNVQADAGDLVESVPTAHTDVDQVQFAKLPSTGSGNGMSDIIKAEAPGVVADSDGMFHPLGDHAQTSYQIDNQPISDQQSKQFSTSLPPNAVQSVEIIEGAPLAEYGDKTSLVINAVTKSGLGQKPYGSISSYYGSFGTLGESFTLGMGTQKVGNFLVANVSRSGRFLDTPEFAALHDVGNSTQFFDHMDYQADEKNTLHLNLGFARNWFQIPNTYDQAESGQDQKQRVMSYNFAPGYVRLFGSSVAWTTNPWFRQDQVSYYPSGNVFNDQPVSLGQSRRLGSLGIRSDVTYVHGHHNIKIGIQASHTFLREFFQLGITDATYNAPCLTSTGDAYTGKSACTAKGLMPNPDFLPGLLPYDLTRGGRQLLFTGGTDIKQFAGFIQDQIKLGSLSINLGIRGDVYHGLVTDSLVQPRFGISYEFKPTSTVIRASYSRSFETPYNENLVFSSATGSGGLANVFGAQAAEPLKPGVRDMYGAGLQQAAGKHLVISADYFLKLTDNAYDFDTLLNTPIAFPISWKKSKIDGVSARVSVPEYRGFSAFLTLGHTRARFFGPESGGLIFNSPVDQSVFRIDHDQAFEQTTSLHYQFKKNGPWTAFTWTYNSGGVAGGIDNITDLLGLTPDQQQQAGVSCGGVQATLTHPITSCAAGQLQASRLSIPAVVNADHSPARIAPRNLFDAAIGWDKIGGSEKRHWTAKFTATNLTNQASLYNFLSTFSGTHWVSPRTLQAEIGYVF